MSPAKVLGAALAAVALLGAAPSPSPRPGTPQSNRDAALGFALHVPADFGQSAPTLTVASGRAVLGPPLRSDGRFAEYLAQLPPSIVTDTRPGAPAWQLTAAVAGWSGSVPAGGSNVVVRLPIGASYPVTLTLTLLT